MHIDTQRVDLELRAEAHSPPIRHDLKDTQSTFTGSLMALRPTLLPPPFLPPPTLPSHCVISRSQSYASWCN